MTESKGGLEILIPELYKDILSPSFKCVGYALKEIIELPCNTILIGTKYLKNGIKKLDEKINGIPEEDRIPIIPELGIPLLRDLSYYSNDFLADMFVGLLAKSANIKTVKDVLPSYIKVIENLSVDEALILEYIYKEFKGRTNINTFNIPCISLKKITKEGNNRVSFINYYNNLSELYFIDGINIKNMDVYIENLVSLGVFRIPSGIISTNENAYKKLENDFEKSFPQYFSDIKSWLGNSEELKVEKGIIELTWLGGNFLKTIHPN